MEFNSVVLDRAIAEFKYSLLLHALVVVMANLINIDEC